MDEILKLKKYIDDVKYNMDAFFDFSITSLKKMEDIVCDNIVVFEIDKKIYRGKEIDTNFIDINIKDLKILYNKLDKMEIEIKQIRKEIMDRLKQARINKKNIGRGNNNE